MLANSILPEEEPMLPSDVTAPFIINVPEVEVTVPPAGTVMVEVAVRLKLARLKVPEAAMVLIEPGLAVKIVVEATGITMSSPFVGTWLAPPFVHVQLAAVL
jgi:hypothetical protein